MKQIKRFISRLDRLQQRFTLTAFGYGVIKKHADDRAGQQAALLTYYGFLALFPLLLVLTTVTDRLIGNYPELKKTVVNGLTDYFPLLGNQLAGHVHGLHGSGPALLVGVLFTLYGARGVADVFRQGVQQMWGVPRREQDGFPKSLFKSLAIIIVGGAGFIFASIMAGLASSAGKGWGFRSLSIAINLVILYWLFAFLMKVSLPSRLRVKQSRVGAATAAIGLVILQALGGYILARQLRNLDALYSYFALTLGLLFWIYLQAQLLYFAVEIGVVKSKRLWPRSLTEVSSPPDPRSV